MHEFKKNSQRDFPSSPVVRTPHCRCQGPGFDPWSGNKDPTRRAAWPKEKKRKKRKEKYSQQTILIENNIYISNIVDNMIILIII